MSLFREAVHEKKLTQRVKKLSACHKYVPARLCPCARPHAHSLPASRPNPCRVQDEGSVLAQHVKAYKFLLEAQEEIEKEDVVSVGSNAMLTAIPRKASLPFSSAMTSLFYCYLYHADEREGRVCCPDTIRKVVRSALYASSCLSRVHLLQIATMNEKQLEVANVRALVCKQEWAQVTAIREVSQFTIQLCSVQHTTTTTT
jgi:hypothetical protein